MDKNIEIQPFGEVCFEDEFRIYKEKWDEFFFNHTHHLQVALEPQTYLIVGRRGSGKSSLVKFLQHQNKFLNPYFINLGKAERYNSDLFLLAKNFEDKWEISVEKLSDLWDYIFWQCIFKELSTSDEIILNAIKENTNEKSITNFIRITIKALLEKIKLGDINSIYEIITNTNKDKKVLEAKNKVINLIGTKALFIVVDSREQYNVNDATEMQVISALIQAAANFNIKYRSSRLFIKLCIADEIYPYLKEKFVINTLKTMKNPLFMFWRPKELLRLVGWRLYKYFEKANINNASFANIDWNDYNNVSKKILYNFFGTTLKNRRGKVEKTLPYILRHTQLRPRQLVLICNNIANLAVREGNNLDSKIPDDIIKDALLDSEIDLADEIINSYSSIYPNVGDIVCALEGMRMQFLGSELDVCAKRSAPHWTHKPYSKENFKKIVIELGIVGRVRSNSETNKSFDIIEADFEYFMKDRLYITEKDECVIHPMFFSKLNINKINSIDKIVYPFPANREFNLDEL